MTREEATARCWIEIDLESLRGNYLRACARVGNARILCVLKGNAYGLGATEICRVLQDCGATLFAVATGDEAEQLLDQCPGAEVLVLGLTGESQTRRLIGKNALMTLFSPEQGQMLIKAASALGTAARVHVKADTGLHRLGFSGPKAAHEIAGLHASGWLRMEGLYTHLALRSAASDEAQFTAFDALEKDCEARGITFPCRHILDSIGMVRYPQRCMDAVRTGAWLFGVTPYRFAEPGQCLPVVSLKARVAQLHPVPKGDYVGYSDTLPLRRDSLIATVTAGYADGFPRVNGEGHVLIRGHRAPIVGLVCMDQLMVDVTDIPLVRPGDTVTLLGGEISLEEFASWLHLNRNDCLARLGHRVPRIYLQENNASALWAETNRNGEIV